MIARHSFLAILSGLITLGVCSPLAAQATLGAQWSSRATLLDWDGPLRCIKALSPDALKTVFVGPTVLHVAIGERLVTLTDSLSAETLSELLWAPDSRAFAVTESEGGWVGQWQVAVYQVRSDSVLKVDLTRAVIASFRKHYSCHEPQDPNIGVVTWTENSGQLLVAAEVPPHSNCREMGMLRAYILEVPTGRIVQEFSETELRARWGRFLGMRLQQPGAGSEGGT